MNWTPWQGVVGFCQRKGKKKGILGKGRDMSAGALAGKHTRGSAMVRCSHARRTGLWCPVLYCVKWNIYLVQNVKGL